MTFLIEACGLGMVALSLSLWTVGLAILSFGAKSLGARGICALMCVAGIVIGPTGGWVAAPVLLPWPHAVSVAAK